MGTMESQKLWAKIHKQKCAENLFTTHDINMIYSPFGALHCTENIFYISSRATETKTNYD